MAPSSTPPAMPSPAHYGAMPQAPRTVEAAGVTQQPRRRRRPRPAMVACIAPARSTRWSTKACARTRRWPQRKRRSPPRRRNCARDRRVDAAVDRRERAGRPHAHAGTFPAQVRKPALQRLRRATAGALHLRPVRRAGSGRTHRRARLRAEAARRALAANIVGTAIGAAALDRQIMLTERAAVAPRPRSKTSSRRSARCPACRRWRRQDAASLTATLRRCASNARAPFTPLRSCSAARPTRRRRFPLSPGCHCRSTCPSPCRPTC